MRRLLLLPLLAACTDPQINEYEDRTGLITGTVILQVPETAVDACAPLPTGGNAIITLFAEDAPPPPEGSSGPVNFIVVPERQLFDEGRQGGGIFAAPFTMPTVAPGRYTVRGFLDADKDFLPTADLLAQFTAGDVGGAYADPATREILPVVVSADQVTAQVTVTLALPVPAERPAFAVTSTPTFTIPFATPKSLVLESHPIDAGAVQLSPECTRFLVSYVDEDLDGTPDDQNGDHLPDVYPRVVLRNLESPDVIVPAIINPFPFVDLLEIAPFVPTTTLELIVPPVAVRQTEAGVEFLPAIPAGDYETVVISGTGQTWQVPNDLATIAPDVDDPTQRQVISFVEGGALPAGRISGTVQTSAEAEGDIYVIAFSAADPPPPAGTGQPRGLATVRAAALTPIVGGAREAPFTIGGLADDAYLLVAILDADGDLAPLVSLTAQPSAGDLGGQAAMPVTVSGGEAAAGRIEVDQPFLFDRPAFSFDRDSIPRMGFPTAMTTRAHAVPPLDISAESARVPLLLAGTDLEGDNLPDLFPRVVLSRLDDGAPDVRTAANDGVIIPGIIDPIRHLSALSSGGSIAAEELRVILPPVALAADGTRLSPPPAGRYRVNVLSATGQTWSVPNELDLVLGRAGGPLEDLTQSGVVVVEDSPVPGGAIVGDIRLLAAEPAGEYQVVVLAFDKQDPPPPTGSGRPRAISVVPSTAFSAGVAAYQLGGLVTGVYQVRAFLDANDSFVPWFDTLNQPDAGDVGGGYLQLPQGVLLDVNVDALGAPAAGIDVSIIDPLTVPVDRPAFWVGTPVPVLDPSDSPVNVTVTALSAQTDILDVNAVFPIQWIDVTGDGVADDINQDGNPDVYPIVIAELLDPDDEANLTVTPGIRLPGIVDPTQFAPAGFPSTDPTATATVVPVTTFTVIFPNLAVPDGRYRITLINSAGQTWSIPNELQRAEGTPLVDTQGVFLTVQD